ncbi:MAG: CDP-alcohol phosphatidyltransferase family protein [Pseudomonadota bacterium]
MFRTDHRDEIQTTERMPPAHQALRISLGLLVLLSLAGYFTLSLPWLPTLVFAVVAVIVFQGATFRYPYHDFGLCNAVTLARAAIVAFLVGALFDPSFSVWLFFGLATVAFALDGVDGRLARRSGLVSGFGGRFDMETDAALAAVLALWILVQGTAGPDILVLGFARYAFVAMSVPFSALRAELPEAFRRKAVCAVQIATLIALVLPVTPLPAAPYLSILAAVLVVWSFAIDILWLLRRET